MLQDGRIRLRLQPRQQDRLLLLADLPWAARNRLTRQRPGLLLPHNIAFDGRDTHAKTPGGFSHGLTVGHHPDNALTQVN